MKAKFINESDFNSIKQSEDAKYEINIGIGAIGDVTSISNSGADIFFKI